MSEGGSDTSLEESFINIAAESPSDPSLTASYERLDDIPIREDIVHSNGLHKPYQRTPPLDNVDTKLNNDPVFASPPKGLPDVHIDHNRDDYDSLTGSSESHSSSAPPSTPADPADLRVSVSTLSLRQRDRDRSHRRHTYDPRHGGRKHHNAKQYRELERILLSVSTQSKDMRQVLRSALDQLEQSRSRAARSERLALELTQRSREANDERLVNIRQGNAIREELGMYKIQLLNAQAEIRRAQDLLATQESMKRDAEENAAKARDRARELEREKLIREAREEGQRLGYREGIRAGRRIGFYDGREEGYNEERRQRPDRREEEYDEVVGQSPDRIVVDGLDQSDEEDPLTPRGGRTEPGDYSAYFSYHDPVPEETGPPGLNDRAVPSENDLTVPGPAPSELLDNGQPASLSRARHIRGRRRASGSGSDSDASTSTLPMAARDFNPNNIGTQTRAPRLPTPNIPSPIPEVVNTEPTSSRTASRRGSVFVDPNGVDVHRTPSQRSQHSIRSRSGDRGPDPIIAGPDPSQPIPVPITPESMDGYRDEQGGFVRGPPPHTASQPMPNSHERGHPGSTPGPRMVALGRGPPRGGGDNFSDISERRDNDQRTRVKQDIADYIRGDGAEEERRMAAHRAVLSPPRNGPPRRRPVKLSTPAPLAGSLGSASGTEPFQAHDRSRNQSMSSTGSRATQRQYPAPQQPTVIPPQQQLQVPGPPQQYVPPPRQRQGSFSIRSALKQALSNNNRHPHPSTTEQAGVTPGSSSEPITIAVQTPSVSTTSQPRNYTDDEYLSSRYRPPQMPTPSSTGGRRSPSAQSHMQAFSRAPSDSQSTFFAAAGPSSDQRTGVPGTGYSRAGEGWDNRGAMSPERLPPWTTAHDNPSSASGLGPQVQSPRSSGHLRQASAPQTASTPASTNIRSGHHSRSASTSNPRNSDYPQHQPLQNVASSSSAVYSDAPYYVGASVPVPASVASASSRPSRSSSRAQTTQPASGAIYRTPTDAVNVNPQSAVQHPSGHTRQYNQPTNVPVPASGYGQSSPRVRDERLPQDHGPSEPRPTSPRVYEPRQDQWPGQHRASTQPSNMSGGNRLPQYEGSMSGAPSGVQNINYGYVNGSRTVPPTSFATSTTGAPSAPNFYGGYSSGPNVSGVPAGPQPVSYTAQTPHVASQRSNSTRAPGVARSASNYSPSGSEALPHPPPSVHRSPYRGPVMIPPRSRDARSPSPRPSPRASPRPIPPALPIPVPGNSAASLGQLNEANHIEPTMVGSPNGSPSPTNPESSIGGVIRRLSKRNSKKDKGKQKVDINRISAPISPIIGSAAGLYPSPRSASPSGHYGVVGRDGLLSRSPSPGLLAAGGSPYGSDVSLPLRPGSPFKHYNPNEAADIADLASASAERLPMYNYR